ncbi:MAG: serine--tRNA ligase [Elusimicrobia bacterium]|nr:serine--tRNA ligase [Elusimicrobiota bacterium]
MIDIRLIRQDPERARAGIRNRGGRYLPVLDELIELDARYRKKLAFVEDIRGRRNAASKKIGAAMAVKDQAAATQLKTEAGNLKGDLDREEDALKTLAVAVRTASMSLPNLPHDSVPMGNGPEDNVVVRTGLETRPAGFKALDHHGLGEKLGILDFASAAKLSGSRFALLRGAGARLERALISFMLEKHLAKGYEEIWPPYLVKREIAEGTGQLPKFEPDLYKTSAGEEEGSGDMFLIPTAEVPLTNLVREQIINESVLPVKLVSFTPCFRLEAGSYGKDVRGLIRVHQFDKVELVWITKPEDSLAALEQLTADAEDVLKDLEIPHRVVSLCAADLGFASRKTYDLEVWMPGEAKWREISSCSDCADFQARRMEARFRRGAQGDAEFVHTLNGSGVAVGRLFAAVLENFQLADGSVRLPKALVPHFGADAIPPRR